MNVIGVHGRKRRGKDTIAKIAAELLGGTTKVVSPADNLKMLLCEALGVEYADLAEALKVMEDCKDNWTIEVRRHESWDPETEGSKGRLQPEWHCIEPVTTISGRQLHQFTGDGARRVFGEDFWMDQVLPPCTPYIGEDMIRAAELHGRPDTLIIPSIRYENEAERVLDYDGIVIEVVRPGMLADGDSFVSEQPLDRKLISYQIVNDGTLDDLRAKTRVVLQDAGLL